MKNNIIDLNPLLGSLTPGRDDDRSRWSPLRSSLRGVAWFLRRASSRRIMRESSMLVREWAAEQLEERQSDWAYSRHVVILDVLWNLAFVVVVVVVLVSNMEETPMMPLRLWILGYTMQCLLHMACVCVEYCRRRQRRRGLSAEDVGWNRSGGTTGPPR